MDLFSIIGSYIILWFLALFMLLPIGIQSQLEAGNIVKGSEPGAPVKLNLKKKMLWATGLALVFLGILLFIVQTGILYRGK